MNELIRDPIVEGNVLEAIRKAQEMFDSLPWLAIHPALKDSEVAKACRAVGMRVQETPLLPENTVAVVKPLRLGAGQA